MAVSVAEALRVARLIEATRVPFAFLGDIRQNLARGLFNDIDLLVARSDLDTVVGVLVQRLGRRQYELINCVENDYSRQLSWYSRRSGALLKVDLLSSLSYRGLPYLELDPGGGCVESRRGFPVVGDVETALYITLRNILWTTTVESRYGPYLATVAGREPAAFLRRLRGVVGVRSARRVMTILADGTRRPVRMARLSFMARSLLRRPLSSVKGVWNHLRLLRRRFRDYPGLMIVLLGPDGSGKTAVIRALAGRNAACAGLVHRHLFPGWLRLGGRGAGGGPVENPHGSRNRGPLLSTVKLMIWLLEFSLGYFLKVWRLLERGQVIVFDRYYHDILVDPRRYRYGGPAWLARCVGRFVAAPDLCIVLDAPPQVLSRRKREVSVDEMLRQRDAYRRLAHIFAHGVVVDASGPLEEVVSSVSDAVLDVLAARAGRRVARIAARRSSASASAGHKTA